MTDEPMRPDPDRLLEQTAEAHRGKLKIFFGACAGVGKTFAMLTEAQRLRAQGLDILIGVVETHGRKETASLLKGLATQPPRRISHRGRLVTEFDLDAALARRPALILMDELAHSNAPGSRHPKRWQDVEELLEAGIDVFTTVNVQHLESLNDVVSGVTGIQVRETVPDPFFDSADEVVLVDLPPDDLRQRLKEGKVYVGDRAERQRQSGLFLPLLAEIGHQPQPFFAVRKTSFVDQHPGVAFVAQNGVSFLQQDEAVDSHRKLSHYFSDVSFYQAAIPTYYGGIMTFAWATDNEALRHLSSEIIQARFHKSNLKCRYYNPAIHTAAFALPQYLHDALSAP